MTLTDDLNGLLSDYHPGPRVQRRVPEGWAGEPYTRFTVEGLTPTIGAIVTGLSLAEDVDAELFGQLNRALLARQLLLELVGEVGGEPGGDGALGACDHPALGALAPGIHVAGFGPALWGSLLLTLLNLGVGALLGSR